MDAGELRGGGHGAGKCCGMQDQSPDAVRASPSVALASSEGPSTFLAAGKKGALTLNKGSTLIRCPALLSTLDIH